MSAMVGSSHEAYGRTQGRWGKLDFAELEDAIVTGDIRMVFALTADNAGRLRGERLEAGFFLKQAGAGEGFPVPLAGWSVDIESEFRAGLDGVGGITTGVENCILHPDLSTIRVVPWLTRTAVVMCDAVFKEGDVPIEIAPRTILKRQIERLAAHGLSVRCASELEFVSFKTSFEEAWNNGYRELTPTSRYRAPYDSLQAVFDEDLIGAIHGDMQLAGIEIEAHTGEVGVGQQELKLAPAEALEMADRHALYKWGTKAVAARLGMSVTFMAKWNIAELGNSCHIHCSLWDLAGKTPRSAEADGTTSSPVMDAFTAGLVDSARELTLMFAPNVNSYRRFQPLSLAPTMVVWGEDNRTCALRRVGRGSSLRLENRIPGADVNPYLAIAGTICAGLHGIESDLALPPKTEGNAYASDTAAQLPVSLEEAINAFVNSEVAKVGLTPPVHDHLAAVGREEYLAFLAEVVTDWEQRRFFERA